MEGKASAQLDMMRRGHAQERGACQKVMTWTWPLVDRISCGQIVWMQEHDMCGCRDVAWKGHGVWEGMQDSTWCTSEHAWNWPH